MRFLIKKRCFMGIPEEKFDVEIGLTLPSQAHESVQKKASTWHKVTSGLESPEEFRVQVLNIRSARKEDLPKIQQAFEEVKRSMEGVQFTVDTPKTCLVGRGIGLAAKDKEGKLDQLLTKFREALNKAGVSEATITSKEALNPHIPLVQPKSEKDPGFLLPGHSISKENRIRWEAVPTEHLVMRTKPQERR